MDDITKRFNEMDKAINVRSTPLSQAVATLVLASVVQEVGNALVEALNQLPAELKHTYLQAQAGEYRP